MKPSQSFILKKQYLNARQRYLEKLRTFTPKKNRTIKDTAKVLDALKLQHKFISSEIRRLQKTITALKSKGKKVNPRLIQRLEKISNEDKENQQRAKLIEAYFLEEMKMP